MKKFAALFHDLDSMTKTNDRLDRLVTYFENACHEDSIWVCWFLAGNRIKGAIKTGELRSFLSEKVNLPLWLIEECHDRVGDLAETVSLLAGSDSGNKSFGLNKIIREFLLPLRAMDTEERKTTLYRAWDQLSMDEMLPFHKLLTGGFRMGVSKGNLCKALARVGKVEPAVIAQRLSGNWTCDDLTMEDILDPPDEGKDGMNRPFPFCLASPLQEKATSLGEVEDWQVEWKWDGIRAQLLTTGGGGGMLWSRGEESIDESFPEVLECIPYLPPGLCMDGEILAWGREGLRSFSRLQKRLGRKNPGPSIQRKEPVRFQAYDLLRVDGKDLRSLSMGERRKKLEDLLNKMPGHLPLGISPLVHEKSWDDLEIRRKESRDRGVEGFMLKRRDSKYESGRVKGAWFKWKVDPFLADMVVVSAQLGHGKRANLYSDYSLAVWDESGRLVTVAKAYSGLSNEEIEEVDKFVRKNITGKFGPVRGVNPSLVFEIAFEGAQASGRHKSGVALRFPRIHRWRKDKKIEEADTLEMIRGYAGMNENITMADGHKTDSDGNLLLF
jgi:DNA ligase-1